MFEENENDEEAIKVIFLGESKVGKTSLITRFTKDIFETYLVSTNGVLSYEKHYKINNKNILYTLWDTAGQERYRGMGRQFYQNAKIGILVYDINSYKTFKEIKDYWYNELIENSSKDISNLKYLYIIIYYSCCNCWK